MNQHLYRRASALALVLALCLSLSLPAQAAETEAAGHLKDTALEAAASAMTYGSAASISWAVWQEGAVTESGSLANPSGPAAERTDLGEIYGIGSVSKVYTTAAVLKLAEAGKLSLDAPVVQYLPAFKMADERYRDITVRMLLNHSSGLMGSTLASGLLFDDSDPAAKEQFLQRLADQRLKADPGAYSVYCNDGFTLAELVVEAVSGQDFMAYLRASLLSDLSDTYAPSEDFANRADIYAGEDTRPLPKDCLNLLGAGGLYASAADLAAFGGALTGGSLLSAASLEAMAAPEYAKGLWPEGGAPDALAFGLGWDNVEWFPFAQNGITILVKGGDTQYYHAGLVVLPEHHMAAAVLSSGGSSLYNEMAASQMLIAALAAKGVTVDETAPVLPEAAPASMPKELTEHSGYYGSLMQYQITVTEDGRLTMHYLGVPDVPDTVFSYYSDGTFRDETNASCLQFVKEDNGQTYLYQRAFTQLPGLGGLGTANYAAVKLPENAISPELQALWDSSLSRINCLPMNEPYSSQIYLSLSSTAQTAATQAAAGETPLEGVPGYIGPLRIVDETKAQYSLQIPGNMGRDGYDLEFRKDNQDRFWLHQSNGAVYLDEQAAPVLSLGQGSAVSTVQPDGYARWYRIGENAEGKTMAVQVPEDAGFWVYNAQGVLTASSVLWDDASAVLQAGGLAVFAGDPGAQFTLTYS